MPEATKTETPAFFVEEDAEGTVILTLPREVFDADTSLGKPGSVRLYLTGEEHDKLYMALNLYGAAKVIDKFERFVGTLPRESVRRDLGRAGVKVLRRMVAMRHDKKVAEAQVERLFEALNPYLEKIGLGK